MKIPYKLIGIVSAITIIIASIVAVTAHYATKPESNPAFQKSTESTTPVTASDKSLIVYFSDTGQPYYPNPPMGMANLNELAGFINDITDSDVYEIVPTERYPIDLTAASERAENELNNRIFPNIANPLPDTAEYKTVFIGFPIWFGEPPMIVQSFLRENNFNDATIIPFMTHAVAEDSLAFDAGDRIPHKKAEESALSTLKKLYPQAHFLKPFITTSSQIYYEPEDVQEKVRAWIDGLDELEITAAPPTTVSLEPKK